MPSFHHGAVEIAYLDEGEGEPILLVHGFASTKNVNWVYPTWVSELKRSGRRVIAFDNRGHGESSKLYDAGDYEIAAMASDIAALMDHLNIERADMMGYSLGSRMTAVLARERPQRLRSAILGGIGIGLIEGGGPGENVAKALEADTLEDVTDPVGRIITSLPLGTEGVLDAGLPAKVEPTLYFYSGDRPIGLILGIVLVIATMRRRNGL